MKKYNIFNKIALILFFVSFPALSGDFYPETEEDLLELNKAINNYRELLIQQDKLTPLDEIGLLKPEDQDPLDLLKKIRMCYTPLIKTLKKNAIDLSVSAYADLAETLFGFIKKRCLYVNCSNKDDVHLNSLDANKIIDHFKALAPNGKPIPDDVVFNGLNKITPIFKIIETKIKKTDRDEKFREVFCKFSKEIETARNENRINYKWFMLFSDQLSVLTSELLYRSYFTINTRYFEYLEYVDQRHNEDKFPCFSEKKYLIHSGRQDKFMSLPGLSGLLDSVFMMPYPFPLEAIDFINFAVDEGQLVWPCGTVYRSIVADGYWHCPRTFYGHDQHHLGLLMSSFLAPQVTFITEIDLEIIESDNFKLSLSNIIFNAKKFLKIYTTIGKELYSLISKVSDPDTKNIYSFFAFFDCHEAVKTSDSRLEGMFRIGVHEEYDDSNYYDAYNYIPLYPDHVQKLKKKEIKKYLIEKSDEYDEFIRKNTSTGLNDLLNIYFKSYSNKFLYALGGCLTNHQVYSIQAAPIFIGYDAYLCKQVFTFLISFELSEPQPIIKLKWNFISDGLNVSHELEKNLESYMSETIKIVEVDHEKLIEEHSERFIIKVANYCRNFLQTLGVL